MSRGSVTAIIGCMFSGKSTRLLEQVRRADLGRRRFTLVKPRRDDRYSECEVVSHDGRRYPCEVVVTSADILHVVPADVEMVFIDEGQFFDDELPIVVNILAQRGVRVVVAGLDLDFRSEPFETMFPIILGAEDVIKLTAICDNCGEDACRSQLLVDGQPSMSGDVIQVGGAESYEARCRHCYSPPQAVYARERELAATTA